MPRIPVRVEPYNSPSRQHRHYKNKRDQVLRALGKAAYINGSHFAIMWVSARGDVETYASEALQTRLDDWFVKGGIADEARQLVKSVGRGSGRSTEVFEDSDEEEDGDGGEDSDPFLDAKEEGKLPIKGKGKRGLAPLNTTIANAHFLRSRAMFPGSSTLADDVFSTAPRSAPLFPSSTLPASVNDNEAPRPPLTSTPILGSSARLRNSLTSSSLLTTTSPPLIEITLSNLASRTAFLSLRFGQLQQGVCKTVAKAWIKIIEPKKQTRCPYNKGEAGKPAWWPAGVRHKEPDHLMKPERHLLLLTILRSPKVKVARLQLATAEVVALIKADKVSLLMDVYRVAREEEKLREREGGADVDDQEIKVGVSTLDGWCAEESGMTSHGRSVARSVTPEVVASTEKNNAGEKRKRVTAAATATSASTSTAMVKSHSTGGGGAAAAKKRRSIATSSLSAEVRPAAPSRATPLFGGMYDPMQHQQLIGLGLVAPPSTSTTHTGLEVMPRSHSFSATSSSQPTNGTSPLFPPSLANTSSSTGSADTSPWPTYGFPTAAQVHGLVTPLTGSSSSSSIDAAFHPHTFFYPPPPPPAHPHPHPAASFGPGTEFTSYPPPAPASASAGGHHLPTELLSAAPDSSFNASCNFDNWTFAQFDLVPDLSHSSSSTTSASTWNASAHSHHHHQHHPSASGDASFTFDTSVGSTEAAGADPRTPSPGPGPLDCANALRLDLAGTTGAAAAKRTTTEHEVELHPDLVDAGGGRATAPASASQHQHQHQTYWLGLNGHPPQHQHHHQQQQQQS